jgi:hypothetical protein
MSARMAYVSPTLEEARYLLLRLQRLPLVQWQQVMYAKSQTLNTSATQNLSNSHMPEHIFFWKKMQYVRT